MQAAHIKYLRCELEECHALLTCLPENGGWQTRALRRRQQEVAERLASALSEFSRLTEEITDPELRLIFELRYFRGYTWEEVASHLPVRLSADGVRMKHNRYLSSIRKEGSMGLSSAQSS